MHFLSWPCDFTKKHLYSSNCQKCVLTFPSALFFPQLKCYYLGILYLHECRKIGAEISFFLCHSCKKNTYVYILWFDLMWNQLFSSKYQCKKNSFKKCFSQMLFLKNQRIDSKSGIFQSVTCFSNSILFIRIIVICFNDVLSYTGSKQTSNRK